MSTVAQGKFVILAYTKDNIPYFVEVDASGYIQVAIESSALPTDAATETTLSAVSDRLGALTSPASGSVNKQLENLLGRIGALTSPASGSVNKQLADLLTELGQKLETADLSITASKELKVLLTALVGAVETSLVAYSGGILKTALGYGAISRLGVAGAVASQAAWTNALEIVASGILESVSFSTNYSASELEVWIDGDALYLLSDGGTAAYAVSPTKLNDIGGENTLWKASLYNDSNTKYHLYLRRPVQYLSTLTIRYRQQSGASKNIGCQAYYRGFA